SHLPPRHRPGNTGGPARAAIAHGFTYTGEAWSEMGAACLHCIWALGPSRRAEQACRTSAPRLAASLGGAANLSGAAIATKYVAVSAYPQSAKARFDFTPGIRGLKPPHRRLPAPWCA